VGADFVRRVHGRGLRVFVYTVNDTADFLCLRKLGVDGVFTDHPARLVALRTDGGDAPCRG
jgi:glycerophosphoryl diester phosphodiesterase